MTALPDIMAPKEMNWILIPPVPGGFRLMGERMLPEFARMQSKPEPWLPVPMMTGRAA